MNAESKNNQRLLESRIQDLEQLTRRIPSRFAGGGGASSTPPLYFIAGGNLLVSGLSVGIVKRTDAVAGTEMPVGTGGAPGDTVTVLANPIPANLPPGVGVGVHCITGAYSFLLLDSRASYASDLPINRRAYAAGTVNLDRVSGGITYRYVCLLIMAGY